MKYDLLLLFLNFIIAVHSKTRHCPDKSLRTWRCPGEICSSSNECLGSKCECQHENLDECRCEIDKEFDLVSKSADKLTNIFEGYLDIGEECLHSKFCYSGNCKKLNEKRVCIITKGYRNVQKNDNQPNSGKKPTNSNDNPSSKNPPPLPNDFADPCVRFQWIATIHKVV